MAKDFFSWWMKNRKKDADLINKQQYTVNGKDFSDVGVDNTKYNFDVLAAELGIYPTFIGSSSVGGYGSTYGGYFSFQGGSGTYPLFGMHSICRLYRWMCADADIRWAVDEITNEMISTNENDKIVDLNLDDLEISDSIKDKMRDEFENILNMMDFKNTAHFHCSNFYMDGRCFYKLDIDKKNLKKGITKIKLISPFDVVGYFDRNFTSMSPGATEKLKMASGYILSENVYNNIQFTGLTRRTPSKNISEYIAVPDDLIIYQHSGVVDWKYNMPTSYLQFALKTVNQLRSLKDAMIIYRMTRAPERFVFNVEVGKMQHSKAEQYVRNVSDRLKETIMYDQDTGAFKDKNDKLSIYKDWYFPKVNGQGTTVDTIQAGQMMGQVEEIEYLQKVLFRQLYIPFSRYFQESSFRFDNNGEMERSEIKFFKHVKKLQIQYNSIFYDMLKRQLSFKNIVSEKDFDEYKKAINIVWGAENVYNSEKNTALIRKVSSTLSDLSYHDGKYVSRRWIYENVLGMDEKEQKEIEKQIEKDLVKNSYLERVKNGEIKFDKKGNELVEDPMTGKLITKEEAALQPPVQLPNDNQQPNELGQNPNPEENPEDIPLANQLPNEEIEKAWNDNEYVSDDEEKLKGK